MSLSARKIDPQQTPLAEAFSASPTLMRVEKLGREQTPVLIFDLSMLLADFLIKRASSYGPDWQPASTIYPGIWSKVPEGYEQALLDFIRPYVEQHFFPAEGKAQKFPAEVKAQKIVSSYAMAVTDKQALKVGQRLPHYDSIDPYQLAAVHYLCDESFGGTGFFRHRATGIEKVTNERHAAFMAAVQSELKEQGDPAAEFSGNCQQTFESLLDCSAKLGRLVVYPSTLLHAGLVNSAKNTERNPKQGRLTITSFMKYAR